ncbi:hypothetical protein WN944_025802 [Citrus x changshan-huyou]|uniref:Uncharacterized protein n=1 Tax=Citrus x changshan-huyou TaxID=2935761 RepID=A0AAP0LQZ7_9ROSI
MKVCCHVEATQEEIEDIKSATEEALKRAVEGELQGGVNKSKRKQLKLQPMSESLTLNYCIKKQ